MRRQSLVSGMMRCVFSPRRQGWGVWRRTYQSNHPTEKWNQIPIQIYIPPNQDPKRRISLCVLLNPSACTMALRILRNVKSARANRMALPDISTSEWWVVCDWHFHSKSGSIALKMRDMYRESERKSNGRWCGSFQTRALPFTSVSLGLFKV